MSRTRNRMRLSRKEKIRALMDGFGYTKKEARMCLEDMGDF